MVKWPLLSADKSKKAKDWLISFWSITVTVNYLTSWMNVFTKFATMHSGIVFSINNTFDATKALSGVHQMLDHKMLKTIKRATDTYHIVQANAPAFKQDLSRETVYKCKPKLREKEMEVC